MFGFAFVARGQAPVSGEPGHGSFDHPTMLAAFVVGLDALAGDTDRDAAVMDPSSELGLVVGLVGVRFGRFAAPGATAGFDRRGRQHERFERVGAVGVRGGDGDRER